MAIALSSLQSFEFGKHYGKTKQDYLATGTGLSSSSLVNGTVRAIQDTISFTEDNTNQEVVFGWKFPEDCLLLTGGIAIKTAVALSTGLAGNLFDGVSGSANFVQTIFAPIETDVVNAVDNFYDDHSQFVSKGSSIGFAPLVAGTILTGVEASYYLMYMSNM